MDDSRARCYDEHVPTDTLIDLDRLQREIVAGHRPSRGVALGLVLALRDADVGAFRGVPMSVMRLVNIHGLDVESAMACRDRGERWCSWHGRFEPGHTFRAPPAADCRQGERTRDSLRRDR